MRPFRSLGFGVAAAISLAACSSSTSNDIKSVSAEEADVTLFVAETILTMDKATPHKGASVIAVEGDKIVWIGDDLNTASDALTNKNFYIDRSFEDDVIM
ncbi:MAG: hypothetical protein ACPGVT_13465, partial [Maricaulaceae bacterium]